MTLDLFSLTIIALVAVLTPIIADFIPEKVIPETVFLLVFGALLGPYVVGAIQLTDSVDMLSELGLGFLFLMAGYEIDPKTLTGRQGTIGAVTWCATLALALGVTLTIPYVTGDSLTAHFASALVLTTTALGTLLPILQERNLMGTRVGKSVLAYGTWGELLPRSSWLSCCQAARHGKPQPSCWRSPWSACCCFSSRHGRNRGSSTRIASF